MIGLTKKPMHQARLKPPIFRTVGRRSTSWAIGGFLLPTRSASVSRCRTSPVSICIQTRKERRACAAPDSCLGVQITPLISFARCEGFLISVLWNGSEGARSSTVDIGDATPIRPRFICVGIYLGSFHVRAQFCLISGVAPPPDYGFGKVNLHRERSIYIKLC